MHTFPRPVLFLALGALVGSVGSVMGTALASRPRLELPPQPLDERRDLQDEVERAVLLQAMEAERREVMLSWLAVLGEAPVSLWAQELVEGAPSDGGDDRSTGEDGDASHEQDGDGR